MTYDNVLQDEAENIIRAYLDSPEAPIRSAADDANWALIRTAWTSCNDIDAVKAAGAKPIVDILEKIQAVIPLAGVGYGGSSTITAADSKALAAAQ